nr:MAG TPA: hypothetical protein [Caudoviricetes sp.]
MNRQAPQCCCYVLLLDLPLHLVEQIEIMDYVKKHIFVLLVIALHRPLAVL